MMKRTILHIATAVMMLAIFTACESEDLQTTFGGGNARSIKLLLNAQGDEITRAVSRSDRNNAYGENTIATADVFFYDENGGLLYDVDRGNVTLSAPDANGVVTATVPMPSDNTDLTQAAKVYVMGNRQAADADVNRAKDSEAALRALKFTTDLTAVPTAATTFAMDGTGDITVTGNEISGTVELVRNAAKITLTVNLPKTLDADGKTYAPQTNGITVTFNEGVKTFGYETDVFDVEQRAGTAGTVDGNGNTPVTFAPFYSYPTTWETGDENEPYFTLHVLWGETNPDGSVTTYKTYHYRVPINKTHFEDDNKTLALNRNHWYQVSVNVGVLGTPEASDEVELTADYEVKPWGNLPIGADLLDFKYLVVDQREISIYNVADAQITFASSNDVTVTIDKIEYKYYGLATTRTVTITSSNKSVSPTATNFSDNNKYADYKLKNANQVLTSGNVTLDKDAKVIDFSHTILDNTYVPHEIYLTVKHTNDTTGEYEEQVKITQYPPIYIIGAQSNGKVFVNEKTSNPSDDNGGGLGSITTSVSGSDNAVNQNKNQYDIYVTVLPSTMNYMIGDPRTTTGGTLSGITELTEYRPTRQGAENVIAPAFKIASSYGKTTDLSTYAAAERRCASYQENGYPAGRWRVPTQAEIAFIQERSANGDIPSLFNGAVYDGNEYSGYWTAYNMAYWPGYDSDGNVKGPTGGAYTTDEVNCTEHAVRCVYDVWYWGNENTGNYYNANGTLVTNNPNYQLTNAVWGDTGSVIVK